MFNMPTPVLLHTISINISIVFITYYMLHTICYYYYYILYYIYTHYVIILLLLFGIHYILCITHCILLSI